MRIPESRAYKGYDVFIGLDVDKHSYAITSLRGEEVQILKIPADEEAFYNFIKHEYNGSKVVCAYEAGPTGYYLRDYLRERECPCLVTPPSTIMKQQNERVKNNNLDSGKIADQLKAGQLKAIRVPEGVYRELRHLINARENYVEKRRQSRQRIKSLLLFEHLYPQMKDPDNNWSREYIKQLRELPCNNGSVRLRLETLISDHDYACSQLLMIYKRLKEFVQQNPGLQQQVKLQRTIPGVGFVLATTMLGRTGAPEEMKNERELACFAGLTPREHSTGDLVRRGHISRFGNSVLRSLLVESAWTAIRKDTELRMFYERIYKNNHKDCASRKAIVAVARKLTMRIYRVLKDQRPYQIH